MKYFSRKQRQIPSNVLFGILVIGAICSLPFRAMAAPGDLDLTFGNGGILTDWSDRATGVAIQPDGKIVVTGFGYSSSDHDFKVARYLPNGRPDETFGGGTGRVTTDIGGKDDSLSVAIQPDGKIVVAGTVFGPIFGAFAMVRYNPDGSLDREFGSGSGTVLTRATDCNWKYAYLATADVTILPGGKIVGVVGWGDWDENCDKDGMMMRFDPDGSLDISFGIRGSVLTQYDLGSIDLQPADEKLVAVADSNRKMMRFNKDGSLDRSFGSGGMVDLGGYSVRRVAIDAEDKIVAAGTLFRSSSDSDFAIFRFNSDGSPDTSFDADGIVITSISAEFDRAASVVIQSDAKIVAAGTSSGDFALIRYEPDGSLDNTFGGGDGITTVDVGGSADNGYDVTLDNRGRAVLVGASANKFAIARFLLAPTRASTDFDGTDGDGKTDIAVYRNGEWYLLQSTAGFSAVQFASPGNKPISSAFMQ